jgi:hypothetical protein
MSSRLGHIPAMSDGMSCDPKYTGSDVAPAAPNEFAIGASPPAQTPRPKAAAEIVTKVSSSKHGHGLFQKKLTIDIKE